MAIIVASLWSLEVEAKRQAAHLVTRQEMDDRPLPFRLRDGIAQLLTPYL